MADTAPSSSSPASNSGPLITSLNANDVILGRGAGPGQFLGNQRFRSLVEERKEEYISIRGHKHKAKARITKDLVDYIHTRGGRFLKPVESGRLVDSAWYEVEESVALEKCMQALRDHRKNCREKQGNVSLEQSFENESVLPPYGSSSGLAGIAEALPSRNRAAHGEPPSLPVHHLNLEPVLPTILAGNSRGPQVSDVRLRMPQLESTNPVHPPQLSRQIQNDARALLGAYPFAGRNSQGLLQVQQVTAEVAYKRQQATRNVAEVQSGGAPIGTGQRQDIDTIVGSSSHSTSESRVSTAVSEDEVSDFLLFCFQASGQKRFTQEQEEMEQATMTDEEKAAALSDLFGRSSISTHKSKKARLDLDRKSIEFLVHQMRLELERIPQNEKRALVEAQAKCGEDEFSDARLERFLRCEGMNAKLGAQRFANYWESRREVFGPEKFVLRMTLSEALCDDFDAVEVCVCRPLSNLNTSGRQLLLVAPGRHTRKGCTRESMLRAMWYAIEVLAQANTDIGSGVVMIVWDKDFTIWHYDGRLYERMTYFDMKCWPVKIIARHVCVAPWFVVNIIKPIRYALIDKHTRSRILIHDGPESQILNVLSDYGILKDMLLTEMGGTVRFDQAEWIANRRAAELGEI